jgi:hypothetical protein
MATVGQLIAFYRARGAVLEPYRPPRLLRRHHIKIVPRAIFYDDAGAALSLSGLTLTYTLRDLVTNVLVVNRQAVTLEDQMLLPGQAFYALTAGQVANAMTGVEEWSIDHGASGTETFPAGPLVQLVHILLDVDGA